MMPLVWPFISGFAAAALVVPLVIAWQRRAHIGQQIYEDGPRDHAVKQGTPTMGGLAFLAAALAGLAFSRDAADARLLLLVGGACAIGAADDLVKLFYRRALGLKARWKFGLLTVLAAVYLAMLWQSQGPALAVERWFGGFVTLPPWLWWLLSMCAIVGSANAVNLADGLDGLATGSIIAPLVVLSLAALSPLSVGVLGGCVAFLWYNRHPAQIFMGDAGSLSLGALLAGAAVQSGWLLLLPLAGAVFVVETLSVIAQVLSFKLTGKRILKMSPLHHHYELLGWSEWRVTSTFIAASTAATCATVVALLLAMPGLYRIPMH